MSESLAPTELEAAPARATSGRRLALACLLLIVLNLAVFAQTLSFKFLIWDDEFYIVPHLQREGGLTPNSIVWAFQTRQAGWFTPLPYLSLLADTEMYGLEPGGYHLTNVLLHMANTLLLLVVLWRMTAAIGPATMAAALFAIHPLHVEPVVWITCRWELLCGFFWLLGMWAYVGYCRQGGIWRYLAVLLAFLCAMWSKPMALTFPFALLLLDYWPLERLGTARGGRDLAAASRLATVGLRRALWEKLPLFLLMALMGYQALRIKTQFFATRPLVHFSLVERLANSIETYGLCLLQFFWPSSLNFFYPHPALSGGFIWWRVAVIGALLVLVTVAVLLARRRYLVVGWCWYLGVFVPAIGLLQVEEHARADRYLYLPLIGLAIMVSWGVAEICWAAPRIWNARSGVAWSGMALAGVALAGLLPCAALAYRQASYWRDSETLMQYGADTDPRNFKAWYNLGNLATREQQFARAEQFYRRGTQVHDTARGHYLIARSLSRQDKIDAALESLQASLRRDPDYTSARALRASLLRLQGRTAESDEQYEEMIRRRPDDFLANVWYAENLARRGAWERAADYYRRALAMQPESPIVSRQLGESLEKAGQAEQAARFYREYAARYPGRVDVQDRLAWLLATHPVASLRNGEEARALAERLCQLSDYSNRFVLDTLAAACAEQGDYDQAVQRAEQALQLARLADDSQHREQLKLRLDLYRQREPYRDAIRFPSPAANGARSVTNQKTRGAIPSNALRADARDNIRN